jgi:predicted amidohydrolase
MRLRDQLYETGLGTVYVHSLLWICAYDKVLTKTPVVRRRRLVGVTTVVDGGSASCLTVAGLCHLIAERSNTRILAFLHVACHGLAGAGCSGSELGKGGESDHLNAIKVDQTVSCIKANRDFIVGVKVRLDKNITDAAGRTEHEVYRRALSAARQAGVPLMVHHTNSGIPLGSENQSDLSCPGSMRSGDVYTHLYSGVDSLILEDRKGKAGGRAVSKSVKRYGVSAIMYSI